MESKRFKSVLGTIAAAIVTFGAASASAADISVVTPLGTRTADAVLEATFIQGNKTFDDFIQFVLPSSSMTGWTVTASVAGGSGVSVLSSSLYAGSLTSLAGSPTLVATGISDPTDPASLWTFDPGTPNLAALKSGSYTLVLSGVTLKDGGSVGGTLSVTPVPEPETYAMFLAGLGLLGMIVRRRVGDVGKTAI